MDENRVFIIIPAYNEQNHISKVIEDLLEYDYKIVVVDDGSKDKTAEICARFPITLLQHKINRGQGAALQTGTEFAIKNNAGIIAHFDGDGQFLANEIERVIAPILSNQADIILGSRFLRHKFAQTGKQINTDNKVPFLKKKIILPLAKIINYFLTGIKLTDAHCGFRAMNRTVAQKIIITQDGMSHNTEIVSQIKKYNLKYKEVPVTVIYNEFGQGVGGGVRILRDWFFDKLVNN